MKILKMNIAPVLIYVVAGCMLLAFSFVPSHIVISILRILGGATILAPFVILLWLSVNEYLRGRE